MQRRGKEEELREELQFHLDEEAEEKLAEGASAEEARWAARRELGNMALVREDTRSAWGWTLVEQFGQDLRYAFRTMSASKSFSLLAILTLALGIGANTAIYSFMDSILLWSLPVADPESLVVLNWHSQARKMFDRGSNTVVHGMSGSIYSDPKSGLEPEPAGQPGPLTRRIGLRSQPPGGSGNSGSLPQAEPSSRKDHRR